MASIPYAEYELRPWVGYGVEVERLDLQGLSSKRRVLGVEVPGTARAYLRADLERLGLLNDWLGEVPVLVLMSPGGEARFFPAGVCRLDLGIHTRARQAHR
jgi:hypothetical protein